MYLPGEASTYYGDVDDYGGTMPEPPGWGVPDDGRFHWLIFTWASSPMSGTIRVGGVTYDVTAYINIGPYGYSAEGVIGMGIFSLLAEKIFIFKTALTEEQQETLELL
jgi:hypothetical protein